MRWIIVASVLCLASAVHGEDAKLRIICFGAHPDDCELKVGGTAALWAAKGHHVKFVSVTNGDIGHWRDSREVLAKRRKAEVEQCARILGVTTEILDIHDGELEPTLAHRKTITRLIREWQADIVMSHRPNDYHPDHRYTGVLVQDAAYMVAVPKFLPEVAVVKRNPVFMYYSDGFLKPNPFTADVVVATDRTIEKKVAGLAVMVSQFFEGGALGSPELIAGDAQAHARRHAMVREAHLARDRRTAQRFKDRVVATYGAERASKIEFVEAFEICEYGRRPDPGELKKLFPFEE